MFTFPPGDFLIENKKIQLILFYLDISLIWLGIEYMWMSKIYFLLCILQIQYNKLLLGSVTS